MRRGCRRRRGSGRQPSRSFLSTGNKGRLLKGKQGNARREVGRGGFNTVCLLQRSLFSLEEDFLVTAAFKY